MPPVPAATGQVFEVVIEGRQEGQQVLNVMHFKARTEVDDIQVRLLQVVLTCFITNLIPVMGSNYQIVMVRAKRVVPDVGPIIELKPAPGADIQGEATGDTEPTFVSALISIRTSRGGRSGRGRMFLPGVPEGATSGSYIETTNPYWTALAAFAVCIATSFIKSPFELGANVIDIGVMSRKIGGAKPPYTAQGFAPATSLEPRNKLASTVSRKVGRGS